MWGIFGDRPLFFMGIEDAYYKTRMTWFLKSIDFYLWYAIQNDPHNHTKIEMECLFLNPLKNVINMMRKRLN